MGLNAADASEDSEPRASIDSYSLSRMQRPPLREGWVARDRLLEDLTRAAHHPVVLIAAAAGYGKTTLAAQWLAGDRSSPAAQAWLTLDATDNDPAVLWWHVATALEQAGCRLSVDAARSVAANGGNLVQAVVPKLLTAMAAMPDGVSLVLDDFHFLQEPACLEQLQFLVEHLPSGAHLWIATRTDPGLRLGRLRAGGQLGEIRAADLAFNLEEVSWWLARQQVELGEEVARQLLDRTEGWPAALGLAIMSMVGQTDPDAFVRQLGGSNRFIGEYLTDEVLSQQTDRVREFITAMSILDRFSPELCDYVLETTGSARILRELEHENMFLLALDEERRWFRFHRLFAAVAFGELEGTQPDRIPVLHTRAARWFRARGHIEEALKHLLASGDRGEAALVVQANWMKHVDAGQAATVLRWFEAVGAPASAADPAAGVTAAWMAGISGDEATLAAHLATLEECRDYGPLPDGTRSVESATAMIQALFGYGGPVEMLAAAQRAVELETNPQSAHHAIAHLTLGHAAYVSGDLELAGRALTRAAQSGASPTITRILALSTHSLVESERGQHQHSRTLAEGAMGLVDTHGRTAAPEASLAFTALGQAQAAADKLAAAMSTVEQGLALRRNDPARAPWMTLHHLLVAARVADEVGRESMARELLDEASSRMGRFSDGMGAMRSRLSVVEQRLRARPEPVSTVESLTGREQRVLRLLQSDLSLGEIASELELSPNTVKTHTRSLYRKLGAQSRKQAVSIARQRLLI